MFVILVENQNPSFGDIEVDTEDGNYTVNLNF